MNGIILRLVIDIYGNYSCWYLGPAENGMKACGDRLEILSNVNRSGSNLCQTQINIINQECK